MDERRAGEIEKRMKPKNYNKMIDKFIQAHSFLSWDLGVTIFYNNFHIFKSKQNPQKSTNFINQLLWEIDKKQMVRRSGGGEEARGV